MYIYLETWDKKKKSLLLVKKSTLIVLIKFQVREIFHILLCNQKIYFNNNCLMNDKSLNEYKVSTGDILKVIIIWIFIIHFIWFFIQQIFDITVFDPKPEQTPELIQNFKKLLQEHKYFTWTLGNEVFHKPQEIEIQCQLYHKNQTIDCFDKETQSWFEAKIIKVLLINNKKTKYVGMPILGIVRDHFMLP